VCTYQTQSVELRGSGKGQAGWFSLSSASVYFDHPAHYSAEHALNIDFLNLDGPTPSRVAVELDPVSAGHLARAILEAIKATEPVDSR
jgi:hypothetical protein